MSFPRESGDEERRYTLQRSAEKVGYAITYSLKYFSKDISSLKSQGAYSRVTLFEDVVGQAGA